MMILVVVARCSGGLLVIRDEETSNQATILHKSPLLSAQHEADGVFLGLLSSPFFNSPPLPLQVYVCYVHAYKVQRVAGLSLVCLGLNLLSLDW